MTSPCIRKVFTSGFGQTNPAGGLTRRRKCTESALRLQNLCKLLKFKRQYSSTRREASVLSGLQSTFSCDSVWLCVFPQLPLRWGDYLYESQIKLGRSGLWACLCISEWAAAVHWISAAVSFLCFYQISEWLSQITFLSSRRKEYSIQLLHFL